MRSVFIYITFSPRCISPPLISPMYAHRCGNLCGRLIVAHLNNIKLVRGYIICGYSSRNRKATLRALSRLLHLRPGAAHVRATGTACTAQGTAHTAPAAPRAPNRPRAPIGPAPHRRTPGEASLARPRESPRGRTLIRTLEQACQALLVEAQSEIEGRRSGEV